MSWKYLTHVVNVVHAALFLIELPQGAVAVKFPTVKITWYPLVWSRLFQLKLKIHQYFTSLCCHRSASETWLHTVC